MRVKISYSKHLGNQSYSLQKQLPTRCPSRCSIFFFGHTRTESMLIWKSGHQGLLYFCPVTQTLSLSLSLYFSVLDLFRGKGWDPLFIPYNPSLAMSNASPAHRSLCQAAAEYSAAHTHTCAFASPHTEITGHWVQARISIAYPYQSLPWTPGNRNSLLSVSTGAKSLVFFTGSTLNEPVSHLGHCKCKITQYTASINTIVNQLFCLDM